MEKLQNLKKQMSSLKWNASLDKIDELLNWAQKKQPSYLDYLIKITDAELTYQQDRAMARRLKQASLPIQYELEQFDLSHQNGISEQQLNQLRELHWLDQQYNLILMGPSGLGKSFIAAGLVYDAITNGYNALFRTMQQICDTLKLKDITRTASVEYRRLTKTQLLVIDDMMMFPIDKNTANQLFHLINTLHEKTSLIVTTNKSPKEWAQVMDDEVLATALLDRLLYRCEVIKLSGKSYRMANRKTIFNENQA